MKYISTRGNAPAKTFTEILLAGLAPDGGLYLPEEYPQVTRAELDVWRNLSYAELAFAVLAKFATDIPADDLKALIDKTYTAEGTTTVVRIRIFHRLPLCARCCRAYIFWNCPTDLRWRSRTWQCSCWAICSNMH